ncbi:hypothetical protein BC952_1679 [Flavobacterium limicola]|uniref:Uncharacterized protein n=1 Tax=Flavobacterium limicola TaxID=180441 RepID=A0A495S2K4_9FLAO|nr:hypothetical protein BC952_1679 [Flavobacterium limicola]
MKKLNEIISKQLSLYNAHTIINDESFAITKVKFLLIIKRTINYSFFPLRKLTLIFL